METFTYFALKVQIMATKTALKRGPKPKDYSLIKVPVTIWVPRKDKHAAQAACDKIAAKYR